jgi:fluoroquinolone resistance protein
MKMIYIDQIWENIDFTKFCLEKGSYENCSFYNCTFTSINLSNFIFEDCNFENCDLSLVSLSNTSLKNISFHSCKLVGVKFEDCNPFLLQLNCIDSNLKLSPFYKLNLKGSTFHTCSLAECDFTESDISGINFEKCDFSNAIFQQTKLQKTNLYTAFNFSIDPENNQIKNAIFSTQNCRNLLDKYGVQIK